jgi:hypothetical protein
MKNLLYKKIKVANFNIISDFSRIYWNILEPSRTFWNFLEASRINLNFYTSTSNMLIYVKIKWSSQLKLEVRNSPKKNSCIYLKPLVCSPDFKNLFKK